MSNRVVITGISISSCLGSDKDTIVQNLKAGNSGVSVFDEFTKSNMKSCIAGIPIPHQHRKNNDIPHSIKRFMSPSAEIISNSIYDLIERDCITPQDIASERTGLIVGSGGGDSKMLFNYGMDHHQKKKVTPFGVPRTMVSSCSAPVSSQYKIQGPCYTVGSACASSLQAIVNGYHLIQTGAQDIVLCGGVDVLSWTIGFLFDAMRVLARNYENNPTKASCPFNHKRNGFVMSGGGGIAILESLENAKKRKAKIKAELFGVSSTSDGAGVVQPDGKGAYRALKGAMSSMPPNRKVDYINAHATSTTLGDLVECEIIAQCFRDYPVKPYVSSSKSMTGHALGACGILETAFCMYMMEENFIAPSINIERLDEKIDPSVRIVQNVSIPYKINCFMNNSFGFGGTNCSIVAGKMED